MNLPHDCPSFDKMDAENSAAYGGSDASPSQNDQRPHASLAPSDDQPATVHVRVPPVPSMPPRHAVGVKAAPPVPPKIPGKAPPPLPQGKKSVSGPTLAANPVPSAQAGDKQQAVNDLINIHWKPASSQGFHAQKRLSATPDNDQFLKPFSVVPSTSLERLVRDNPLPSVLLGHREDQTVFSSISDYGRIPPVQKDVIKKYFTKKQNNKFENILPNQSAVSREDGAGKKTGLERERVKLLALALGGTITTRVNRRGIFRQYREAIIRCDYQTVTTDIMCPLLQLLKGVQEEEMQASLNYVNTEVWSSQLPEAMVLEEFEESDVFLYEMSKVPEVKIRLECMIFERTFDDLFQITVNSLNIIYSGLEVIASKIDRITTLFQLILRTGNFLNEGSKLGSNQGSFSLATLAKLTEVKSSVDPKLDVLHFILSHIPAEDAVLFSDEDLVKLKNATNLRCYRVRDEVKDLLDSIVAVTEIVKHPIPSAGEEDRFTLRMSQFAQRINGTEQWLSQYAFNVLASYKKLSAYFEDTKSVYPPPKEKSPDQFDIIELFAWFGGIVKTHEKDIKKKGLRSRVLGCESPAVLSAPVSVYPVSPPEITASPAVVFKAGSPDPSYVLEPATTGGNTNRSLGGSRPLLTSEKNLLSVPSLTKEQLQSSLSSLGSPAAPPLVAIINRGTNNDLTASKPKLSPVIAPSIGVMVTPATSPPVSPRHNEALRPPPFAAAEGSRRTLSVRELAAGASAKALPPPLSRSRHMLITPGGAKRGSQPDIMISVSSGLPPPAPVVSEETTRNNESTDFFAKRAYPSRNEEFFPNYAVLNSRQSLSNTISRVVNQILSPTKEDGSTGIYKGTRRRVPSLSAETPERGN